MIIYLATWMEDNQGITLTKVGNTQRLMSYFFLKDINILQDYIRDGIAITKKKT